MNEKVGSEKEQGGAGVNVSGRVGLFVNCTKRRYVRHEITNASIP